MALPDISVDPTEYGRVTFTGLIVGRTWWINRHEAADLGAALIAAAKHAGDTQ